MNYESEDIHIIVRSVGERTRELCIQRLSEQFGEDRISCIENVTPFWRAIEQSYNVGIQSEKKWILIIDADVILYEEYIGCFLKEADCLFKKNENAGVRVFCIQPYVYDNFFRCARLAGVHLYRANRLEEAICYCSNSEINSLRPETYIKRKMADQGYYSFDISEVVGIHDYMQSYRSIVKKGILHVNKHSNSKDLIELWKKYSYEEDYKWILEGARIGVGLKDGCVKVDNEYMDMLVDREGLAFPVQNEPTYNELKRILNEHEFESVNRCLYGSYEDQFRTSRPRGLRSILGGRR